MMRKSVLFLEPFYGGSHKDFADGLVASSEHSVQLATLPARFWKWRMSGASLYFVREVPDPSSYDCVFATDLMSLADLKALWGKKSPPIILYCHENQLSYPLPEGKKPAYHYGFTDITSCLTADKVLFNSHFHKNDFFTHLPVFIRRMPEFQPLWVIDEIERKTSVLYPGINFYHIQSDTFGSASTKSKEAPLIIWNHRWEYDKQPELFFTALRSVRKRGARFKLALLGENFRRAPKLFSQAKEEFKENIVNYGYIPEKKEYIRWLTRGDIVISTSCQENFGISVMEAIRYGCRPLLPKRLAYPELIPEEFHKICLYEDEAELEAKLYGLLTGEEVQPLPRLIDYADSFSWVNRIGDFDELFSTVTNETNEN